MFRNVFRWLLKAAVAGVLALAAASLVCVIYYNPPAHFSSPSGATDHVWEANRFTGEMREGFAWNRTDANGHYNILGPDSGMDVLLMGSSHVEGAHVFARQNIPYLLAQATDRSVYSIGASGHDLLVCAKNLDAALELYQPKDFVVIETRTTAFDAAAIEDCLAKRMPTIPSYESGLMIALQKIVYAKLAYAQLQSWNSTGADAAVMPPILTEEAYTALIRHIAETAAEHGVQPVLFYHPTLTLETTGDVRPQNDAASLALLADACREQDVLFVDMTADFMQMYADRQVLPHGFFNTAVGQGHLNVHGNKAISDRLAAELAGHEVQHREAGQ